MLNKDVCYKCYLGKRDEWAAHLEKTHIRHFKDLWKSGLAPCDTQDCQNVQIKLDPPKNCPYLLEHLTNKKK
jgi:hypothetical protein